MPSADVPILGTRGSELALWQAHRVRDLLREQGVEVQVETIVTRGDREQDVPISELGDVAVFTREIDRALLDGTIDFAVHSLKDLPSALPSGTALVAVSERASAFDAFVAHPRFDGTLSDLPEGAVVATASLRRKAMLKAWRPDLQITPVRGNVDTRLEKLDASDWHGMVLAVAGLVRMGRERRICEAIDPAVMLPAVGQGALGVTCRPEDDELADVLRTAVHHEEAAAAARAERAYLHRLGAGCQVPVGAWARPDGAGGLVVDACMASLDGALLLRERRTCAPEEAEATGTALAASLIGQGGDRILAELHHTLPT